MGRYLPLYSQAFLVTGQKGCSKTSVRSFVANRLELLNQDTGLPEAELIELEVRGTTPLPNADELTLQDLQGIQALPGVKSAAVLNQVVYGDNSNNSDCSLDPDRAQRRSPVARGRARASA